MLFNFGPTRPLFLILTILFSLCGSVQAQGSLWHVQDVAIDAEGKTRVMWRHTTGRIVLWRLDSNNDVQNSAADGMDTSGWSGEAMAVGPDNKTRAIWNNTDGRVVLWTASADGTYEGSSVFGPFAGWRAIDITVDSENKMRVLWKHTSNAAVVWRVNSSYIVENDVNEGAYPGAVPKSIAVGTDGNSRLMWQQNGGGMPLWILNSAGQRISDAYYGTFAGWLPMDIAVGADNKAHPLWENTNSGQVSLWRINTAGANEVAYDYGPYAGWRAKSIAHNGSAGRLAWDHVSSGMLSLWKLNAAGSIDGSAPEYNFTPGNLTAAVEPYGKIRLNWEASGGATGFDGYKIYRSESASGPFEFIGEVYGGGWAQKTYLDDNLTAGKTYWYKVTTATHRIESGFSNAASAVVLPAIWIDGVFRSISVGEGAFSALGAHENIVFTLKRDGSAGASSVRVRTQDETAVAPNDYTAIDTVVNFASWETTKTISVSITGDDIPENDESFKIYLSDYVGAVPTNNSTDGYAYGLIIDDDRPEVSRYVDAMIGSAGDTAYVGQDAYSVDGANQMVTQTVAGGVSALYEIYVLNKNSSPSRIQLRDRGQNRNLGWTVRYYDLDNNDVTAQITSNTGWLTPVLASSGANRSYSVTMEVTGASSLVANSVQPVVLEAVSSLTPNGPIDAVKSITTKNGQPTATPTPVPTPTTPPNPSGTEVDALVRNQEEPDFVGAGIANTTGDNQNKTQAVAADGKVAFEVKIENNAPVAKSFTITANTDAGWSSKVFDAYYDGNEVTQMASSQGWVTPSLAPGAAQKMRVELTPVVGSGNMGAALIRAVSGANSDTVKVIGALQNVAGIQYSRDAGATWQMVPNAGLKVPQYNVLGFRAIKSNSQAPWPTLSAAPTWKQGDKTIASETVYLSFPVGTQPGTAAQVVSVKCGNQIQATVRVNPERDVMLTPATDAVLAGSGPAALNRVPLTATVFDENDSAVTNAKVRFRAKFEDGTSAGAFNLVNAEGFTDVNGHVSLTWMGSSQAGRVHFEAEVLDADGDATGEIDQTSIQLSKPYVRVDYGGWSQDVSGNWRRLVTVSTWFLGQKISGRALRLTSVVLDSQGTSLPNAATIAPLQYTVGNTGADGKFVILQNWNPPQTDEWPQDYDVTVAADLTN